jgi:CheY-like chemotaxis protein
MRAQGLEDANLEWARQVIDRQVGNMSRLVDDLLDVSRIATGKLMLRRERIELATVINRAVESCQQLIEAKGHALEIDLSGDPVSLNADEVRLTQVFANLLTNAAKYTDAGGKIRVHAKANCGQAVVSVQDTGVGIRQEMLSEVFGLFTQIVPTIDRTEGGLGVGLALVRRLVELHGGTVIAESPGPGQGSTFTVRLPIAQGDPKSPVADVTLPRQTSAAKTALRVLVVDDNADGAKSLAMLVKIMGHETMTAFNGADGIIAVSSFRPNLIFLDIGLPGMNGYEVCRTIRNDPAVATTKLVALTGWGTEEDKRRAVEAGFDFHLTKPADSALVEEIIASVANNRQ